jgi:hypothetical protein
MPIEEVADTVVVVLIFNRAIMEKTNPSYPLRRYREGGGEEINPQYRETWYREILTLKDLIY